MLECRGIAGGIAERKTDRIRTPECLKRGVRGANRVEVAATDDRGFGARLTGVSAALAPSRDHSVAVVVGGWVHRALHRWSPGDCLRLWLGEQEKRAMADQARLRNATSIAVIAGHVVLEKTLFEGPHLMVTATGGSMVAVTGCVPISSGFG